jgi:hypothetical protein
LGTNVIDAERGSGGKPCAEEPSSCDAPGPPAPEGLAFGQSTEEQITIDNSGAPTDGDIYVTRRSPNVVYIFAKSGEYLGELTEGGSGPFIEPCGVSVDQAGSVYVDDFLSIGGVQKFSPSANPTVDSDFLTSFPEPENPCPLVSGVGSTAGSLFVTKYRGPVFKVDGATKAIAYRFGENTTTEAIDPTSGNVLVASGTEVAEYDASGATQAVKQASVSLAEVQGIAVSPLGDDVYVSRNKTPTLEAGVEVFTDLPTPTVAVGAASEVSRTSAKLSGSVNPEANSVTGCKIEYGLTTSESFEHEAPCDPAAAELPVDSTVHPVSTVVSGLQADSSYRFRITAANANGSASSSSATFTTLGAPRISALLARDAHQSSVTLEATVDPRGLDTSYRFEWGATASYANSLSAGTIGAGEGSRHVSASLAGLSPESIYHYRLVATNDEASVASPDQTLETLDACGLPDQRCFELVSPREPGPTAAPGAVINQTEMHYQAAPGGDRLAYSTEGGLPTSTRGGETLFLGVRGTKEWESAQLSPGQLTRSEASGGFSNPSHILAASPDLSCDVVVSGQPLTSDPAAKLLMENGEANLYRRNADGSFTLISNLTPDNPVLPGSEQSYELEYQIVGMSSDCRHIVFASPYHYPGIAGAGESRLYEWDEGTLKNVGVVPGPSGETPVRAVGGAPENPLDAVSRDGSRVFFSAPKLTAGNPAEVETEGVFVRELVGTEGASGHRVTRDISESETSTPDLGTVYQGATPDGSRVYFTANAGLTSKTSSEGTDLYEYNLETGSLTDLSVDTAPGGAAVAGLVGVSEDGSHVYFAAGGQLQAGAGSTYAQNTSHETYSIYGVSAGVVNYVGTITAGLTGDSGGGAVVSAGGAERWRSRVSPDGRYLLFESSVDLTGYRSHGVPEAYLYDAQGGSDAITCVSCRPKGEASLLPHPVRVLAPDFSGKSLLSPPMSLVERGGEPEVFFVSPDPLAPGAAEGEYNLYTWSRNQVFLVARQPVGASDTPAESHVEFVGASTGGHDLYFAVADALNWEDPQARYGIWDAREGGGFTESPTPISCDPTAESSCQGPSWAVSQGQVAASAIFSGPGDLVAGISNPPARPAAKPLTRAQKLAKALKACRKSRAKPKRVSCEKRARRTYATKHEAKAKPHEGPKRRKGGK